MNIQNKKQVVIVEPYGTEVLVICGEKERDRFLILNDDSENLFPEGSKGSFADHVVDGVMFPIIYMSEELPLTLVHECVHLSHAIMNNYGIPISYDNTEVEAHLVVYLYELIFPVMKKAFN